MLIVTLSDTLWTSVEGYWCGKPHNQTAYYDLKNLKPSKGLVQVLSIDGRSRLFLEVLRDHQGFWCAGGTAKRRLGEGSQTLVDIYGDSHNVDLLKTALKAADTFPHPDVALALGLGVRAVDTVVKIAAAAKKLTAKVSVDVREDDFEKFMEAIERLAGKKLDQRADAVYGKFVDRWQEKIR